MSKRIEILKLDVEKKLIHEGVQYVYFEGGICIPIGLMSNHIDVYKAPIRTVFVSGKHKHYALDKYAQEVVNIFVEAETKTLKDILANTVREYDIKIDQLQCQLKEAKRRWWHVLPWLG